jgi:hypothetical protein
METRTQSAGMRVAQRRRTFGTLAAALGVSGCVVKYQQGGRKR